MTKTYTSKDIQVLTDREHVRVRTCTYLGNTEVTEYKVPLFTKNGLKIKAIEFVPAVYKAVGEILDNSVDEFAQVQSKTHKLKIIADTKNGIYKIKDNGRGIPIDIHESGKPTPEVALGSLRAGRNFINEKEAGVIGQNGVGSACTNYLSTEFSVKINRDKKIYTQLFENGAEFVSDPIIQKGPKLTGTEISFKLDPELFKDISLPDEMMRNKAIEIAFTNPYVTTEYNNEVFRYRNGLDDIIKTFIDDKSCFKFEYFDKNISIEIHVILDYENNIDEQMFTWVNSSLLFDGGICNTQFINAFSEQTILYLEKLAKKQKCKVTRNDVRQNLLIFGNLKISDPQYDAQSKTRLTGPNIKKELNLAIENSWKLFARRHKDWLDAVLERAFERHHINANKKAIDIHKKSLRKRVPGLIDANSRNRSKCELFVTEGDSAARKIAEVRIPEIHASLPLRGKVNNVYGITPAQLLEMGKLTNLISAIGLVPGQKANIENLQYGKIIIATDADPDGADIFCLLINIFYQFWPELFEQKFIYRLIAPNVVVSNKKERIHFPEATEFIKAQDKYKNWEVEYMKGLGSMTTKDWKILMNDPAKYQLSIVNDGKIDETLTLLFGDDINARKQWLQ